MAENVILVDQDDRQIGVAEKLEAHEKGLLHRAISILVFNSDKKILLQKRSKTKYHSGGLWANTCCSHPRPGESLDEAVHRRLPEEMGVDCLLAEKFSFLYKTKFENGLIEHELDHVFFGTYDGSVNPNPDEAEDYKWVSWEFLMNDLEKNPDTYVFWLHEIVKIVNERRLLEDL